VCPARVVERVRSPVRIYEQCASRDPSSRPLTSLAPNTLPSGRSERPDSWIAPITTPYTPRTRDLRSLPLHKPIYIHAPYTSLTDTTDISHRWSDQFNTIRARGPRDFALVLEIYGCGCGCISASASASIALNGSITRMWYCTPRKRTPPVLRPGCGVRGRCQGPREGACAWAEQECASDGAWRGQE
jgi:hypothetical protein